MDMYYFQVDSLLHRLNPLSKVLALLPVAFFVALTTDLWTPVVFIGLALLVTLIVGRVPLFSYLRIAGPLSLLMVSFFVVYPFVMRPEIVADSPVVWQYGPLILYQDALFYCVTMVLRAYALCLISLLFTFTTDSSDFIRSMVQQAKFPYKFGYGALAAFSFVPALETELRMIRAAHKVRGISDRGGVRTLYQRFKRYAIPLLASAIRRSERTALAMDGRAFGAFPRRTYYKQFRFSSRDYWFIVAFWLLSLVLALLLWQLGLLGPLSWTKVI